MKKTKGNKQPDEKKPAKDITRYQLQCPRCGHRFYGDRVCPRCGYNGYFPMNELQIKRIKLILYPILLLAAILVYYFFVYSKS